MDTLSWVGMEGLEPFASSWDSWQRRPQRGVARGSHGGQFMRSPPHPASLPAQRRPLDGPI
eukprot:3603165-Lingulodinium_polyedra.AAC.1